MARGLWTHKCPRHQEIQKHASKSTSALRARITTASHVPIRQASWPYFAPIVISRDQPLNGAANSARLASVQTPCGNATRTSCKVQTRTAGGGYMARRGKVWRKEKLRQHPGGKEPGCSSSMSIRARPGAVDVSPPVARDWHLARREEWGTSRS